MRRFWCTSCFVGERLSDALLFASSNLTNTNSRADQRIFVSGLGLR
jgi:hypothetical protein